MIDNPANCTMVSLGNFGNYYGGGRVSNGILSFSMGGVLSFVGDLSYIDPSAHYYTLGFGEGLTVGQTEGSSAGYDAAFPVAYAAAYDLGVLSGKDSGDQEGALMGATDGFDAGWEAGYGDGQATGYEAGYASYFAGEPKLARLGQSADSMVPEPHAALLALLGALPLLRRRAT